jgi:hypothetical protein
VTGPGYRVAIGDQHVDNQSGDYSRSSPILPGARRTDQCAFSHAGDYRVDPDRLETGAMTEPHLDAHARALMDANSYITLGTADADGTPWVSPVYFATADYAEIFWISAPDARHSRNIAERPDVSMVIFDSTVPPYHGRAVYLSGAAGELAGPDLDRAVEIYPGPASRGASTVTSADVTAPAGYRLYRATISEAFVLCPREPRQPCAAHAIAADHRTPVTPWRPGSSTPSR